MAISVIRRFTNNDAARVRASASRFCHRHGITIDSVEPEVAIEWWIDDAPSGYRAYRAKLWTACFCRALHVQYCTRTTIDYGYIGTRVK